jgi:geranylgeranyl pyrophosphate synthase
MTHAMLVKLIRKRLDKLNMNPHQLHQKLKVKMSKQTVYNFFEHGKEIRTETLLAIMNLLELTICHKERSK